MIARNKRRIFSAHFRKLLKFKDLFPFPPTSHELQYISVTSGFTTLSMKTKYVCRCLISLYVNFHNNRTMWSTNLHVKIGRWGGERKKSHFSVLFSFIFQFYLKKKQVSVFGSFSPHLQIFTCKFVDHIVQLL